MPPENACEASGTHALRVQVGAAPRRPEKCRDAACPKPPPVCAESRFAKPRKFPKGNGFILFASTKRTGSSRRAAALSTPGERFKTLQNSFFVIFPPFVPKPVYSATRFFGCFEPVRKGYYTSDARPVLFENGKLYSKLTGATVFEKGSCSLSLLQWEFVLLVY